MNSADRPAPPPADLLEELRAHQAEYQANQREREEVNRRTNGLRLRARVLAARMNRLGVGAVDLDGWLVWADPAASGLHRKRAPGPAAGSQRHG